MCCIPDGLPTARTTPVKTLGARSGRILPVVVVPRLRFLGLQPGNGTSARSSAAHDDMDFFLAPCIGLSCRVYFVTRMHTLLPLLSIPTT